MLFPPVRILLLTFTKVFKMTKNHNFQRNFAISDSFDETTIEDGLKCDLKLTEHS